MKSLMLSHKNSKLLTLHFAGQIDIKNKARLSNMYRDTQQKYSENFYLNFGRKEHVLVFINLLEKLFIIEESILKNLYWICCEKQVFIKLILKVYFPNCFIYADRVFLNSVYDYEFSLKMEYVLNDHEKRERQSELLLDVALACYIAAIKNINLYEGLVTTASSITQTAAANTATLGIESAMQVVGNAAAGAAVSAVMDVVLSSATIYYAKRQKDRGKITEKEFSTKVKKTVCENSCKFVAGTTGSIIGQVLIPVPVLGAFVGGFCGSLIGCGIGKGINYGVFDRQLKKELEVEKQVEQNYQEPQAFLYRRSFHGYVPKITYYDEAENQFFQKSFERTTKNFLKHELMKTSDFNLTFKLDDQVSIKPLMNKLKVQKDNDIEKLDNENTKQEEKKHWKSAFTMLKFDRPNSELQTDVEETISNEKDKKEPGSEIKETSNDLQRTHKTNNSSPMSDSSIDDNCESPRVTPPDLSKKQSFMSSFSIRKGNDTKDKTTLDLEKDRNFAEKPEKIKTSLSSLKTKFKLLASERSNGNLSQLISDQGTYNEDSKPGESTENRKYAERKDDKDVPSVFTSSPYQNFTSKLKFSSSSTSTETVKTDKSSESKSPTDLQSNDSGIMTNVKGLLTSAIASKRNSFSKSSEDLCGNDINEKSNNQDTNEIFSRIARERSFTRRNKKSSTGKSEVGWLRKKMSFKTALNNNKEKERKKSNELGKNDNEKRNRRENEKLKKVIGTWTAETTNSNNNNNRVTSNEATSPANESVEIKKEVRNRKSSSFDKICNALNEVFQNEPL